MKIDDKVSDIKPHILTMRYQGELSIVDVKLKQGWRVDETKIVGIKKYPDLPNTYMFFSDQVGLDEIIEYVRELINKNIEIENKELLLNAKTAELHEFFKGHTLEELNHLEFVIRPLSSDNFITKIDEEGETKEAVTSEFEETQEMVEEEITGNEES
jgi:hypothetical protein